MTRRASASLIIVAVLALGAAACNPEDAERGAARISDESAGEGCPHGGQGFVDEDGDGACDHAGSCPNFVDEDGDGVCDLRGTGGCGCGGGMGGGMHGGMGPGHGPGHGPGGGCPHRGGMMPSQ